MAPPGAYCPIETAEDGSQTHLPGVGNRWLDWCTSLPEVSNAPQIQAAFDAYCRQRGICRIDGGSQKVSSTRSIKSAVLQLPANFSTPSPPPELTELRRNIKCTLGLGRGTGGKDSSFLGFTDTAAECETLVLAAAPGASGMSYSVKHGDCIVDFGVSQRDADSGWVSCRLNNPAPIAMGSAAQQSGTLGEAHAGLAIDGRAHGCFSLGSCALVGPFTPAEGLWWQVDLGAIIKVDHVDVYHRTDANSGGLRGATITLQNEGGYGKASRTCGALVAAGGYTERPASLSVRDVSFFGGTSAASSLKRKGVASTPMAVDGAVVKIMIAWLQHGGVQCEMLSPAVRGEWTHHAGDDVCIGGDPMNCKPVYRRRGLILAWKDSDWKIGRAEWFDEADGHWANPPAGEVWIATAIGAKTKVPSDGLANPLEMQCVEASAISDTPGCECQGGVSGYATDVTWEITTITSSWEDPADHMPRVIGGPESVDCKNNGEARSGRFVTIQFSSTDDHPQSMAICEVAVWGVPALDLELTPAKDARDEIGCVAKARQDCQAFGGMFGPTSGSCYRLAPVANPALAEDVCAEHYGGGQLAQATDPADYEMLAGLAASTGVPVPILVGRDEAHVAPSEMSSDVVIGYTSFEEVPLDGLRHVGSQDCAAWRTEVWRGTSTFGPAHATGCQGETLHVVIDKHLGLPLLEGRTEQFSVRWTGAVVFGGAPLSIGMISDSTYRFTVRTTSALPGSAKLVVDGKTQELIASTELDVSMGDTVTQAGVPDGWVVVLKTAAGSDEFKYDATNYWSDATTTLNTESPRSEAGNAKYPEYNTLAFSAVMGCVGNITNCLPITRFETPVSNAVELFGGSGGFRDRSIPKDDFVAIFNPQVCAVTTVNPSYVALCNDTATEGNARWGVCNPAGLGCAPSPGQAAAGITPGQATAGFGVTGVGGTTGRGAGVVDSSGAVSDTDSWILVRPVAPLPGCTFRAGRAVGASDQLLGMADSSMGCALMAHDNAPMASGVTFVPVVAALETCTDTIEGENVTDCVAGSYVAGDATTPSTSCPTGCTQVDAMAASCSGTAAVAAVTCSGLTADATCSGEAGCTLNAAASETCSDTIEGEVVADCATGYTAGDATTPSTSCPTGCTQVDAGQAVGECFVVMAMTGRVPEHVNGSMSCKFHGPAREVYADVPTWSNLQSVQLEVSFGDVWYDAGVQLSVTRVPGDSQVTSAAVNGWPAEASRPTFPGSGVAGMSGWGLEAQAVLYRACTGGRNELGFRHFSTTGSLDTGGASVVGVLEHEWSALPVAPAHGEQFFLLSEGTGQVRAIEIGPLNISAYTDVTISVWLRGELPTIDTGAKAFVSYGAAAGSSISSYPYGTAIFDSTVDALQSGWTEYNITIADGAQWSAGMKIIAGAEWAVGEVGTVSFDRVRITGTGPRQLPSTGCFYNVDPENDPTMYHLDSLLPDNKLLVACELPTASPSCNVPNSLPTHWFGGALAQPPDVLQLDEFYAGAYAGTDVTKASLTCVAHADEFGAAYRQYRLSFGANVCVNSFRLLEKSGTAVVSGALSSSSAGWNLRVKQTATGDVLNALSQDRWLCAPQLPCDTDGVEGVAAAGAWLELSVPDKLWPLYVSDYEVQTNAMATVKLEGSMDGTEWVELDARENAAPFRTRATPLLSVGVSETGGTLRVSGSATEALEVVGTAPEVVPGPFGANDGLFFGETSALKVTDMCEYVQRSRRCSNAGLVGDAAGVPQRLATGQCGIPGAIAHQNTVTKSGFDNPGARLGDCNLGTQLELSDDGRAKYSPIDGRPFDESDVASIEVALQDNAAQPGSFTVNGFYIELSETGGRPDFEELYIQFLPDMQRFILKPHSYSDGPRLQIPAANQDGSAAAYALPGRVDATHYRIEVKMLRKEAMTSGGGMQIAEMGVFWDSHVDKYDLVGQEQRGITRSQCEAACDVAAGCTLFEFGLVTKCAAVDGSPGVANRREGTCSGLHQNVTDGLTLWLPFIDSEHSHDYSTNRYSIQRRNAASSPLPSQPGRVVPIPMHPPYGSVAFDGATYLQVRDATIFGGASGSAASCTGTATETSNASCTGTATDPTATPDCALAFSTATGTATDCEIGCTYGAAVVPVCDLDISTDGDGNCPAGCVSTAATAPAARGEGTISAWVLFADVGSLPDDQFQTIFASGAVDSATPFVFAISGRGHLTCGSWPAPWFSANSRRVVLRGMWTHVACSYDATEVSVYVDGQLEEGGPHNDPTFTLDNSGPFVGGEPALERPMTRVREGMCAWSGAMSDSDAAYSATALSAGWDMNNGMRGLTTEECQAAATEAGVVAAMWLECGPPHCVFFAACEQVAWDAAGAPLGYGGPTASCSLDIYVRQIPCGGFQGHIGDVRLYDRVLDDRDVQTLHQETLDSRDSLFTNSSAPSLPGETFCQLSSQPTEWESDSAPIVTCPPPDRELLQYTKPSMCKRDASIWMGENWTLDAFVRRPSSGLPTLVDGEAKYTAALTPMTRVRERMCAWSGAMSDSDAAYAATVLSAGWDMNNGMRGLTTEECQAAATEAGVVAAMWLECGPPHCVFFAACEQVAWDAAGAPLGYGGPTVSCSLDIYVRQMGPLSGASAPTPLTLLPLTATDLSTAANATRSTAELLAAWTPVVKVAGTDLPYDSLDWSGNGTLATDPILGAMGAGTGTAIFGSYRTKRFNSIVICVQLAGTQLTDLSGCLQPQHIAPSLSSTAALFSGPTRHDLTIERDLNTALGQNNACPSYASGVNIVCPDGSRVRWGHCAPDPASGCKRAGGLHTAGLGLSGIAVGSMTGIQMWVLVREHHEPWERLQVVSRPDSIEIYLSGARVHSQARGLVDLPYRKTLSTVANSRSLVAGWGYLSRLHLHSAAWSLEDIAAEGSKCQPTSSAEFLPDAVSVMDATGTVQAVDGSCRWLATQKADDAAASDGALIVDAVSPQELLSLPTIAVGELETADPTASSRFRVGDSVELIGTGWCEDHSGRYKVLSVGPQSQVLLADVVALADSDTQLDPSVSTCSIRRPTYVASGLAGGKGAVDFPAITPEVEEGRPEGEVTLVKRVRFTFGYHIDGGATAVDGPSVVVVLVSDSGREHVVYTSAVLSQCLSQTGTPICSNPMITVDQEVAGFYSRRFHIRLQFISNDYSIELTGVDGDSLNIQTQLCKGMRPPGAPWAVARQEKHWGSERGFLHPGGLSFFPNANIDTSAKASCDDRHRVESRRDLQDGVLTNGRIDVLPHGAAPEEGQTVVKVFSADVTGLLDEWARMPESNRGVRMVPRGLGMYRLDCSLHISYEPQRDSKAPLCRSSECAPGYTGDRCASCVPPRGSEKGFFRNKGLCQPCPSDFQTFIYLAILGLFLFIFAAVYIMRKLRNVKDLGLKLAPLLIWVAFLQTVGLLLDFKIEWPPAVEQVLLAVSSINLNLEVMRPECIESAEGGGSFDFKKKVEMTVIIPMFIVGPLALYYWWNMHRRALAPLFAEDPGSHPDLFPPADPNQDFDPKLHSSDQSPNFDPKRHTGKKTCWLCCFQGPIKSKGKGLSKWCGKRKKKFTEYTPPQRDQVVGKIAAVLAGAFTVLSTPYLRTVCSAYDCSMVEDTAEFSANETKPLPHFFLETEPDVECCYRQDHYLDLGRYVDWSDCALRLPTDKPDKYYDIQTAALQGLFVYLVLLCYFVYMLLTNAKHHLLDFVAAKMDSEWFWYELMLMSRRVLISVISLFSSDGKNLARGWLMCVMVLVTCLTLQVYAKPYRDSADDLCEFLSLLCTLVIYISGGAMVLQGGGDEVGGNTDEMATKEEGGMFEELLSIIVIACIVVQTIVCMVVQSVTVGMTKVDKITIIHVEINVGNLLKSRGENERENIDVVARLCSLASRRDSELYCPGFDLLQRVWLREGGLGDELDMDAEDILAIIEERKGEINQKGLDRLHDSKFSEFWPPAKLDNPAAIDVVTPCAIEEDGRSILMEFETMAEHYNGNGRSAEGIRVQVMNAHELPKAVKHRLLASGMAMDDVEDLDARLERTDTEVEGAACTTYKGGILLNIRCRFEWATLRASEDQLRFVEDLHAGLCEALGVRGTTGEWGHTLPPTATMKSAIMIRSVRRGPDEDIIRQSIEFVIEVFMFVMRLLLACYISARYNRCSKDTSKLPQLLISGTFLRDCLCSQSAVSSFTTRNGSRRSA